MLTNQPTPAIEKAIQQAITKETERIVQEEAVEASKRVEIKVRAMSAQIAANVLSRFTMERMGTELVIRVQFDDFKSKTL